MKIKIIMVAVLSLAVVAVVVIWRSHKLNAENVARMKYRQAKLGQANPSMLLSIQKRNDELENRLKGDSKNADNWLTLGANKLNLGDYEGAEEAFKNAIKYNKVSNIALHNLGSLYVEIGEYEKAENAFRQMIDRQPASEEGYVKLAELYQSGKYGSQHEAESIMMQGIEHCDEPRELISLLIEYYEKSGQADKAVTIRQQLNAISSQSNQQTPETDSGDNNGTKFKIQ